MDTCEYLGYIRGEPRWRSLDGKFLLTWDRCHGEIEAYDKRGRHFGVKAAVTGVWIGDAVRGRRIDV